MAHQAFRPAGGALAIGTDDFRSDAVIWGHRRHLVAPVALKGDGALIDFRRWSARFWPADYQA